jgi:hypothetical protein
VCTYVRCNVHPQCGFSVLFGVEDDAAARTSYHLNTSPASFNPLPAAAGGEPVVCKTYPTTVSPSELLNAKRCSSLWLSVASSWCLQNPLLGLLLARSTLDDDSSRGF